MSQAILVKKTYAKDFEKVYPLLVDFDAYSSAEWRKIFDYHWEGALDHVGYHLERQGEIVGFMGLIFSCRHRNAVKYQFCNITSLIVKPEFRAATLLLLRRLKAYENTIFTGLAPIEESYRLLTRMGFVTFEKHHIILPVLNGLLCNKKNLSIYESEEMFKRLDVENQRIVLDHDNLNCKSILFESKSESALLVYSVSTQKHKGIRITKLHLRYISNLELFNEHLRGILNAFKVRFGLRSAIYIDRRFVSSHRKMLFLTKATYPPKIRSKRFFDQVEIDELYSEMVLL